MSHSMSSPSSVTTPTSPGSGARALQLTLTIHKDATGYGMKVSGDNPVFVESVKANGAAQKAGLFAGDMILKVNGAQVRYSTHTEVVQFIKGEKLAQKFEFFFLNENLVLESPNVELTVQRSHRAHLRPSVVGVAPPSPLGNPRNSITAPLPVDLAKRREMEYSKMQTLSLMLDQERKNLDDLRGCGEVAKSSEIGRAEANIRTLQEQLKQMFGDVRRFFLGKI